MFIDVYWCLLSIETDFDRVLQQLNPSHFTVMLRICPNCLQESAQDSIPTSTPHFFYNDQVDHVDPFTSHTSPFSSSFKHLPRKFSPSHPFQDEPLFNQQIAHPQKIGPNLLTHLFHGLGCREVWVKVVFFLLVFFFWLPVKVFWPSKIATIFTIVSVLTWTSGCHRWAILLPSGEANFSHGLILVIYLSLHSFWTCFLHPNRSEWSLKWREESRKKRSEKSPLNG